MKNYKFLLDRPLTVRLLEPLETCLFAFSLSTSYGFSSNWRRLFFLPLAQVIFLKPRLRRPDILDFDEFTYRRCHQRGNALRLARCKWQTPYNNS